MARISCPSSVLCPVASASPIVLVHYTRDGGGLDRDEPHCGYFEAFQSVLDNWTECEGFTTVQSQRLPLLYLEGHES